MFALLLAAAIGCPFPVPTHTPCEPIGVEQSHERRGDSAYDRGYRDAVRDVERQRARAARDIRTGAYAHGEYEAQIDARVYDGRRYGASVPPPMRYGEERYHAAYRVRGSHFDDHHRLRPGHHADDGCECDCDEEEEVVWVARMSRGGAYGGGADLYTDYSGGGGGGGGGGAASFNGLSYAFTGGSGFGGGGGVGGGGGAGSGSGTGTGTGSGSGSGTGTGTATSTSSASASASINASISAGINIRYGGRIPPVTPPGGGGCNHGCPPPPPPCHTCNTGGGGHYGARTGGGFTAYGVKH